jgi:hypothetical protein
MQLSEPTTTVLGPDSATRIKGLNGNAYQQEAIITFEGWQYAVFYAPLPAAKDDNLLYVHLSRRRLSASKWETIVFEDYEQTTDDSHNTAQIGICAGDGTIHISWDHHTDRYSCPWSFHPPARTEVLTGEL